MKIKFFTIVLFGLIITSCGSSKKVVRTTSTKTNTSRTLHQKPVVVTTEKKSEPVKTTTQSNNETLEATSKVNATTITVTEYINQFKGVAQGNMKTYGIPASIILAQGILESGAGKGRLCLEANNHFGIKCHKEWTGPTITHDDDAAQECFRKYSDPADSYRDHALFLTSRSRYNSLFQLNKLDYKGWAEGLKKAGYATDPKYPSKLIGLIERYQLNLFDEEVTGTSGRSNTVVVVDNSVADASMYTIQKGDTLYSLSKKFNTTVEEIKRLNKLNDNSLSIGQIIKVK